MSATPPTLGALEIPAGHQSFLAVDPGTRLHGLAFGARMLGSGRALPSFRGNADQLIQHMQGVIREWQPDALVMGVPRHPDGAPHDMTRRALGLAQQLRARYRLPVHEVDERYSTTEALSMGAKDPDGVAAVIILEQFFRSIS
jgi:putative Holliday junction resolvase